MKIFVNGDSLNFSLEESTSLDKILIHIQEWGAKEGLYILEYKIPDMIEDVDPQILTSEMIDVLEITMVDQKGLIYEHVLELDRYIDKMGTHIASLIQNQQTESSPNWNELTEGFLWVKDSIKSLAKNNKDIVLPDELINLTAIDKHTNLGQLIDLLIKLRNTVSLWKQNMMLQDLSPEELSINEKSFRSDIPEALINLEKIAGDLTLGKEQLAYQELEVFLNWLGQGMTILSMIGYNKTELNKLSSLILEIHQSVEMADHVNLADILDYDLREVLEKIAVETLSN
jgi:hypothetical protein